MPKWLNRDILYLFLLSVVSYVFLYDLDKVLDIFVWDETNYLCNGLLGQFYPSEGPLYSLWYKFLSYFTSGYVSLYYLNQRLLNYLPYVLMYVFLRLNRVDSFICFVVGCFLIFSPLNQSIKVYSFCLCVVLFGLIVSSYFSDIFYRLLVCWFTSLVCSYVRPEMLLSFFIFSFVLSVIFLFHLRYYRYYLLYIVVCLNMVYFCGFPYSNSRSFLAFSQHFSLNMVTHGFSSVHPFFDCQFVISKYFGSSDSFLSCLLYSPFLIFRHIYYNIVSIVPNIFIFCFPFNIKFYSMTIVSVLFLLPYRLRLVFPFSFFALLIFILPCFVSLCLVHPRQHYLVFFVPMLLMLFSICFRGCFFVGNRVIFFLCLLLFFPFAPKGSVSLRPVVEYVNSLKVSDLCLLYSPLYEIYLPGSLYRYSFQSLYNSGLPASEFIYRNKITMIILCNDFYERFLPWSVGSVDLFSDPLKWGFVCFRVPDSNYKILMRVDLYYRISGIPNF